MVKLAYPTNRPFADRITKKTAYKINRNTQFYKTLLNFELHRLPVVEVIVKSYDYYTNQKINFKGSVLELFSNPDAYCYARQLVQQHDRYNKSPIKISDWTEGNRITMFFSHGESSDGEFLIVWEAAE